MLEEDLHNTIKWRKEVIPIIKERLTILNRYGIVPTLKTIFYTLVILNIIPNSNNYYKYLSRHTKQARIKGELPLNCFADQKLPRVTNSLNELYYAKEYVQKIVKYLEEISSTNILQEYNYNKKEHNNDIEIWIEKNVFSFTFHKLLNNYGVTLVSHKGVDISKFISRNLNRLKQSINNDKKIYIRYFGSFDLFSDNIDIIIRNNIQAFDLNIDFKKIAIREDQMRKFHLPENPSPEIIKKLDNNIRKDFFISKYGRIFQIELESLQAYSPQYFKKITIETITDILKEKNYENSKNINILI